ncbi:hypothetical protein E2320_010239, partial [Naja naja]
MHKTLVRQKSPSNNHKFLLCSFLTKPLPDIYGKESTAAIENGGKRAHQGSHDHSNHETTEVNEAYLTNRHEFHYQLRVGNVGTSHFSTTDFFTDCWIYTTHFICSKEIKA